MRLWDHSGAELLSMPLDALAMLVLEAFGPTGWNVDSFFKGAAQSHGAVYGQPGARTDRGRLGLAGGACAYQHPPHPEQQPERPAHD